MPTVTSRIEARHKLRARAHRAFCARGFAVEGFVAVSIAEEVAVLVVVPTSVMVNWEMEI